MKFSRNVFFFSKLSGRKGPCPANRLHFPSGLHGWRGDFYPDVAELLVDAAFKWLKCDCRSELGPTSGGYCLLILCCGPWSSSALAPLTSTDSVGRGIGLGPVTPYSPSGIVWLSLSEPEWCHSRRRGLHPKHCS